MFIDNDPASVQDFVDLINRLGFQIQCLTIQPDKANGLCAMNIYQCLMMAAAGSKDDNLAAFAKVLGFNPMEVKEAVNRIVELDSYYKTSRAVELSSASSLWHKADLVLEKEWEETIRKTFGATIGPIEVEPINEFIQEATKGKFKGLVSKGDLMAVVLMLVTCLYFKANWETPFNRSLTKKSDFYMFGGKCQTCDMMNRVGMMDYMENGKIQACILPYKSGGGDPSLLGTSASSPSPNWKAAVILPKERGFTAMQAILSTFSASPTSSRDLLVSPGPRGGRSSTGNLKREKVSLSLPKFTLKLKLNLIESLSTLGLTPVFRASSDFAPISRSGVMLINRVTHDMFIEVNEEGTEMAATTIVGMKRKIVKMIEMRIDRPFLFLVFDEVTKLVLCSVVVSELGNDGKIQEGLQ
jgi:serine protease inhibitor